MLKIAATLIALSLSLFTSTTKALSNDDPGSQCVSAGKKEKHLFSRNSTREAYCKLDMFYKGALSSGNVVSKCDFVKQSEMDRFITYLKKDATQKDREKVYRNLGGIYLTVWTTGKTTNDNRIKTAYVQLNEKLLSAKSVDECEKAFITSFGSLIQVLLRE